MFHSVMSRLCVGVGGCVCVLGGGGGDKNGF